MVVNMDEGTELDDVGPAQYTRSHVDIKARSHNPSNTSFIADAMLFTRPTRSKMRQDVDGTSDDPEVVPHSFVGLSMDQQLHEPIDGGYGWVVTLASFLSHMLEGGLERGEGLFFLEFQRKFGMSNQLTSIPSSTSSTLRFLFSPLASMLVNRYSVRATVLLGAVIFTAGIFLTQFATSFVFLVFTYGVVAGIGRAFFSGPALIVIGLYFRQRQGIASGIAASGVGTGAFLFVPLLDMVFHYYSFSEAFLIISAVASHMILVGMAYRPLSVNARYMRLAAIERQRLAKVKQSKQQLAYREKSSDTIDKDSNSNAVGTPSINDERRTTFCNNSVCEILFPTEEFNKNPEMASETTLFQCYLLKNCAFCFYCLTVTLFTVGIKISFLFLPKLMVDKGFDKHQPTIVISSVGPVDTLSRIGIGLLVDFPSIRPHRMRLFNLFLLGMAATLVVVPLAASMTSVIALMAVYSAFGGMCFATRTVVLVDLLGMKKLSSAFGILMFFQGFGTLLGPLLAGWIIDTYNSTYGYYTAFVSMLVAAIAMHFCIFFFKRGVTEEEEVVQNQ